MVTTKISIIVPVYNVKRYLRQCLDLITGQTNIDGSEFMWTTDIRIGLVKYRMNTRNRFVDE